MGFWLIGVAPVRGNSSCAQSCIDVHKPTKSVPYVAWRCVRVRRVAHGNSPKIPLRLSCDLDQFEGLTWQDTPLTATFLKRSARRGGTGSDQEFTDDSLRGFGVKVSPKGTISYYYR